MGTLAIARLQKEIAMLQKDPPPGAWAGPKNDKLTELDASITGPAGTVYEGGVFKLSIHIPMRYPMEPPKVQFVTPVYHCNIDADGRICLDILNPPPKGAWKPSLNLGTVLTCIALLLSDPNPDDGLVPETTHEYIRNRGAFDSKARQWTRQYAVQLADGGGCSAEAAISSKEAPHEKGDDAKAEGGSGGDGGNFVARESGDSGSENRSLLVQLQQGDVADSEKKSLEATAASPASKRSKLSWH